MWQIWLSIFLVFTFNSHHTKSIFIVGSLASLILSLLTHNILLEGICFILTSFLIKLILTYHLLPMHPSLSQTNLTTTQLVGKQGIVIKPLGNNQLEAGLVRLDSETWPAYSLSHTSIKKGTKVQVETIKGVHLLVTLPQKKEMTNN